jgi:hypothetical protein
LPVDERGLKVAVTGEETGLQAAEMLERAVSSVGSPRAVLIPL